MVPITSKPATSRTATAVATLTFSTPATYHALISATLKKGDALAVSRVAGIQAAKKTAGLIPLAHPGLSLTGVEVQIRLVPPTEEEEAELGPGPAAGAGGEAMTTPSTGEEGGAAAAAAAGGGGAGIAGGGASPSPHGAAHLSSTVSCLGATGVEMEALVSVATAALSLYDMCKGIDRGMVVGGVRVVEKRGGRSGDWIWDGRDARGRVGRVVGKKEGEEKGGGGGRE